MTSIARISTLLIAALAVSSAVSAQQTPSPSPPPPPRVVHKNYSTMFRSSPSETRSNAFSCPGQTVKVSWRNETDHTKRPKVYSVKDLRIAVEAGGKRWNVEADTKENLSYLTFINSVTVGCGLDQGGTNGIPNGIVFIDLRGLGKTYPDDGLRNACRSRKGTWQEEDSVSIAFRDGSIIEQNRGIPYCMERS